MKDSVPYSHLTSMDPDQFWTSGQWMTEKRGNNLKSPLIYVLQGLFACFRRL